MTNKEYVKSLLEANLREHGEEDSLSRMLKRQLASMEWAEKNVQPHMTHEFHIGARGEASEDPQLGEYREDMYGNPILSPEEQAEAEAEEEKRQEEEGAN